MNVYCFAILLSFYSCFQLVAEESNFEFKDIKGNEVVYFDDPKIKASVFIFITIDCPIANSFSPEIKRLYEQFNHEQVAFTLVYVDRDMTLKKALKHAKDYGLLEIEHIVIDRDHKIVKLSKAEMTPQAVIMSSNQDIVYSGAINNLFSGYGDKKRQASQHYLKDNLTNYLSGEKIKYKNTKLFGCYIPKD